jgi:hypothetical protein
MWPMSKQPKPKGCKTQCTEALTEESTQ